MNVNNSRKLKDRILEAAENENAFDAAVNYGELKCIETLSEDEDHYYHGLALVANKQYETAINEFLLVSNIANIFDEAILWLGLVYSVSGNINGLFDFFKEYGRQLPNITKTKLIINLILTDKRKSTEVFNDIAERLSHVDSWKQSSVLQRVHLDLREDTLHVIDAITNSIVEATTEIYRYSYMRLANHNNQFVLTDSSKYMKSLNILSTAECLLLPHEIKEQIFHDELINEFVTRENGIRSICNLFYLYDEPPVNVFDNQKWKTAVRIFLDMFINLLPDDLSDQENKEIEIDHMWKSYLVDHMCCPNVINADENFLLDASRKGNNQAVEVLGMYYTVKTIADLPSSISKIQFQGDTLSKRIVNAYKRSLLGVLLDPKADVAFEIAQHQLENAIEHNFVWEDAGPISLSYFRILELEINRLLVKPLCTEENFRKIEGTYNTMMSTAESKSAGAVKKLKNKWGLSFNSLRKMQDTSNSVNGMELGPLLHLLELIRSSDDEMTRIILGILRSILNAEGNVALDSGLISQMISEESREKFRNPPAHTRYLPLNVALECREHVIDSIIQLNGWIKDNDIRRLLYARVNQLYLADKTVKSVDPTKLN